MRQRRKMKDVAWWSSLPDEMDEEKVELEWMESSEGMAWSNKKENSAEWRQKNHQINAIPLEVSTHNKVWNLESEGGGCGVCVCGVVQKVVVGWFVIYRVRREKGECEVCLKLRFQCYLCERQTFFYRLLYLVSSSFP